MPLQATPLVSFTYDTEVAQQEQAIVMVGFLMADFEALRDTPWRSDLSCLLDSRFTMNEPAFKLTSSAIRE
jgi:hypothetical protein